MNLAWGSSWASVIETSPVPGGRSSSRYSSSSQATSSRNCWIALCSIGPRQTTAALSSTKKPIDITLTPLGESSGRTLRSPFAAGLGVDPEHARDRVAVDIAVEGARRVAFGGKRCGQVGGHRRLADTALAGGD